MLSYITRIFSLKVDITFRNMFCLILRFVLLCIPFLHPKHSALFDVVTTRRERWGRGAENHISRHKNLSFHISQETILAIHGSRRRKYPWPPSLKAHCSGFSSMRNEMLILKKIINKIKASQNGGRLNPYSCIRLLSATDCSELTLSDWNSLLGCQGCISLM